MPTSFAPFFLAISILAGVFSMFAFIPFLMNLDDDREYVKRVNLRYLVATLLLIAASAGTFYLSIEK